MHRSHPSSSPPPPSATAPPPPRPAAASSPPRSSRLSALNHLVTLAGAALVPARCAGCGRWETALCPQCLALLAGPLLAVEHLSGTEGLDVQSLCPYAGPARALVLAWKNGAREDLRPVMAQAGRRAGAAWVDGLDPEVQRAVSSRRGLLVVPAPSGRLRRLRGRLVAADLADAVALGIGDSITPAGIRATPGVPAAAPSAPPGATSSPSARPTGVTPDGRVPTPALVASADVLRRGGGRAHQAGLSSRGRRLNRADLPLVLSRVDGWAVLLVDDVVTTGTTLGACARALRDAGALVVGALTVAATPSPISPSADPPTDSAAMV